MATGKGTKDSPWKLTTPSGSSQYEMYRDETSNPPSIVCMVGKTELRYQLRAIDDLHAMLKKHGDWMPLGSADEQKPAAEGTVPARGKLFAKGHQDAGHAPILTARANEPPTHVPSRPLLLGSMAG